MASKVFFIPARREDGNEALAKKAEKLFLNIGLKGQIEKDSFVALKIHFGERGNTGFLKPQWLVNIINQIKSITPRVFLTDSNGLIGRDDDEIQVNLTRIKAAKVASVFFSSDALVCLSHFTGHMLTGFGGALKNLGMGCASRAGKLEQHSDVHPWVNSKLCSNCGVCFDYCPAQAIVEKGESAFIIDEKCIGCGECLVVCSLGAIKFNWDSDSLRVQEKMSEYAYSVWHYLKGKISFINFLLEITKDCDCMSTDQPAIVEDIGILGSLDPVAVDQASVDLVNKRSGKDLLRAGYDVDWSVQLKHGVQIGLGNRDYELIKLT